MKMLIFLAAGFAILFGGALVLLVLKLVPSPGRLKRRWESGVEWLFLDVLGNGLWSWYKPNAARR